MRYARFAGDVISLRNDRIADSDADRQQVAAATVLERFDRQPGVILADEVGMGKTFVALATAVSVLLERGNEHPVVVMTPPSLAGKWPRDFTVFREKCVDRSLRKRFRAASASSGVDFLRLLDDDASTRAHVIFLTHGALNTSIRDGLIKLAVIKRAFKGRSSLSEQRAVFGRFAADLLQMGWIERRAPGLLGDLLERPYADWRRAMLRQDPRLAEQFPDDPIPRHFSDALEAMTSDELGDVVAGLYELPRRESVNIQERLVKARRGIADAMEEVWRITLRRAAFHSPLLILDEAHHVKNPATRLAGLFATPESAKDSEYVDAAGPLGGKFDRMLFLTATPFQLGHAELIRVVERFEGIDWGSPVAPEISLDAFREEVRTLSKSLDDAQSAALRLDRAWGRLTPEHVTAGASLDEMDVWWSELETNPPEGLVAEVRDQVLRARELMLEAERRLTPWVLRHIKQTSLASAPGVPRRVTEDGAAIVGEPAHRGLEIPSGVVLPFLLAGRAQSLIASTSRGRALFAEGLSSSFEAYLETRAGNGNPEEDPDLTASPESGELSWYLTQLDKSLPQGRTDLRAAHPKVQATARKAVELWLAGEKVLVFCHFRATGRALRQHISLKLKEEIRRLASVKLPGMPAERIESHLNELSDRFFDDDQLRRVVGDWVQGITSSYPALGDSERSSIEDVVRRFVRTPSFLVRYLPLSDPDLASGFVHAADHALEGHQSLRSTIDHFCAFLAERCIPEERAEYLGALERVQTGAHGGKEVRQAFDIAEHGADAADASLLPNVRLANGEVRQETRRRLLLTFNTPLFPEILVASSVLAEGVDLHLNCRHVIHHDLCWNPSTLEQRSGRVDRIGCRAELAKSSIRLFMPYLAATQDEKMFRVVRDRERWFQVIMGEKYESDERSTDERAKRVPLPPTVQKTLTMRLHPEPA